MADDEITRIMPVIAGPVRACKRVLSNRVLESVETMHTCWRTGIDLPAEPPAWTYGAQQTLRWDQ